MKAIHPAAKAKAAKFGCEILEVDGSFRLRNIATQALSKDVFDKVGEATETLASDGITSITWEVEKVQTNRSGVMVVGYHQQYSSNPHGPGCNDDLDITLRDATRNDDGTMNLDKLREIGTLSGLFRLEWERLNPGFQRMNLANRMRGWLRNNPGNITVGEKSGRFGIEMVEKKARSKKNK